MYTSDIFPSEFAKKLCVGVKLYDGKFLATGRTKKDSAFELKINLQEFQQLSISDLELKDCLFAYHGKLLTKKQKDVLEIIHKLTKPFLLGHISGILTEAMEKTSNKNFLQAAELLVGEGGVMRKETESGNGNVYLYFDGQDAEA